IFAAVEAAAPPRPLLLLSAAGRRFDHSVAAELAAGDGFSLLCGRYEGVDQRVADHLCDGELSVGGFVVAGGGAAAGGGGRGGGRGGRGGGATGGGGHGQRRVRSRRVVCHRAARVPAVHAPGRVPRPRGPRRVAERRPRQGGALAAGAGAATHAGPPARSAAP